MSTKRGAETVDRILDTAERLVQVRGFNAFSYADIAKALHIRKASLHHHFATKADLGVALVGRYRRTFMTALGSIEAGSDAATERLARYVELYAAVLRRKRMCMCGMLASDAATLPTAMRDSVAEFFVENQAWLTRVLERARSVDKVQFEGSPASMAALIVSSLEGAMLVARGRNDPESFDEVAQHLLANLREPARKSKRRAG